MSLIVLPLSDIFPPIGPGVCALPIFFVAAIVAFVTSPVRPCVYSISVLLIILPLPFIFFLIGPRTNSKALNSTVDPASVVYFPRGVVVSSFSVPPSLLEHPFVPVSVAIYFYARAMLHVIFPVAFVLCIGFSMHEYAIAIGFVILPLSLVIISVDVGKLAFALSLVIDPLPLIHCSIWPLLLAVAIPHVPQPLSFILDSILKSLQRLFLSLNSFLCVDLFGDGSISRFYLLPFLMDFGLKISLV